MSMYPPPQSDYVHVNDYDPPDADWIDYASLATSYRLQVDANKPGHYRHRYPGELGPWVKGHPATENDE